MADDLEASKTPGFKVGDKKTLDEYQKLGESLTEAALHLIDCHRLGSDSDSGSWAPFPSDRSSDSR